jgi:hypothetical protein
MEELMGGFFSDLGKVVTAPFKAVGHAGMEIGRGINRGDPLRVLAAPFKGIGHFFGETFRGTTGSLGAFYRPSKMVRWMPLAGPTLTTFSVFLPPPFNVAGLLTGAAITTAGGVAGRIQADKYASEMQDAQLRKQAQMKGWAYTGLAVAGGGVLLYTMMS